MKQFFILLLILPLLIISCKRDSSIDEGILTDAGKITDKLIEEHNRYSAESLDDEYIDNYSDETLYNGSTQRTS